MIIIINSEIINQDKRIVILANNMACGDNPSETISIHLSPIFNNSQYVKSKSSFIDKLLGNDITDMGLTSYFKKDQNWIGFNSFKINKRNYDKIVKIIRYNFWSNYIIDKLYVYGPVGSISNGVYNVFTNYTFWIGYKENRIVEANLTCDYPKIIEMNGTISMDYRVRWFESGLKSLHSNEIVELGAKNYYMKFSTVNSAIIALVLIIVVIIHYYKVYHSDPTRNNLKAPFDSIDYDFIIERGWKALHGDVFREPLHSHFLSFMFGFGVHFFFSFLIYSFLSKFSILPVLSSKALLFIISLFASSPISGFLMAFISKTLGHKKWLRDVLLLGLGYPSFILCFLIIKSNLSLFFGFSHRIPLYALSIIVFLIVTIVIPLWGIGGWIFRKIKIFDRINGETGIIARKVGNLPWWIPLPLLMVFYGLIISSTFFVNLHYLYTYIWTDKNQICWENMIFGLFLMIIVSSMCSIQVVFLLFQYENSHWYWPSFLSGSSSIVYFIVFSIRFYQRQTNMHGVFQKFMFFSISIVISLGLGLSCGAFGLIGAKMMVNKIFLNLKAD